MRELLLPALSVALIVLGAVAGWRGRTDIQPTTCPDDGSVAEDIAWSTAMEDGVARRPPQHLAHTERRGCPACTRLAHPTAAQDRAAIQAGTPRQLRRIK